MVTLDPPAKRNYAIAELGVSVFGGRDEPDNWGKMSSLILKSLFSF